MEINVFVKTTLENLKQLNLVDDVEASYDVITTSFTGVPEGILENMDELSIVGMILSTVGHGEIDYDDGTYTSSQDKIYSFDAEVFPIERMYARFIDGIKTIMAEDVQFTNVIEETGGVDWESGTGTWILRFECNGKPYEFAAKMNCDWFDTSIIGFMNSVLKEQGTEKRLLLTGDGMQTCILFYKDIRWAKEYERIIGYELYCPLLTE